MRQKISVLLIMLMVTSVFAMVQSIEIEQGFTDQVEKTVVRDSFSYESSYEEWNVTLGGWNIDIGYDVQQTSDGGYIIVGYTRSYGDTSGRNIWLVKTDEFGTEEWNTTFGGDADDEGHSVHQTMDGGYIITGQTKSFGSENNDVILIKTDGLGNEEFMKIFGGEFDDEGYSVQQTTDGGYIVAGATTSFATGGRNAWLIKTDGKGNETWSSTIGGLSSDGARSVHQTTDGGYIFTGWTASYSAGYLFDIWLVKTDEFGNEEWSNNWGGTGVEADHGHSVRQTTDGGYILTGETQSFGGDNYDAILIKTDEFGNEEWLKTFVGPYREYGHDVQQTMDGGYIMVGYTVSYGPGSDDVWVIRTDASGNELYNDTYGGTSSDVAYGIQLTTDGGYIIVGHTLSYGAGMHDVWLIKIADDPHGPPTANFTFEPSNPIANELIYFNSTSYVNDPSGFIVNWTWEMGDGTILYDENVTYSYAFNGTYQVNLTVMDDNFATDSISKLVFVGGIVEIIDVDQSIVDRGFNIRHTADGDWAGAQSFLPTVSTITRVELFIRQFGVAPFDLVVELRENHPQTGTLLRTMTFTSPDVSGDWGWLDVDFDNVTVTPGVEYFIVIPPAPDGVTSSFGYEWGYAFGDLYPDGSLWFTRVGGVWWLALPQYEFSFRIYGLM